MTLRQVIEEIGYDYMEEVRNGSSLIELAEESGHRKCACCGQWEESGEMELSDGMTEGHNICSFCFEHKKSKKVVRQAIEVAVRNGYASYAESSEGHLPPVESKP